jgi:soluble lytic murein transglycosylase-like protein
MRSLILVLNILIGSSLLAQPAGVLAASTDAKSHKNHHRGKSKDSRLLSTKQKKSQYPGDVWERIRSGMQIPRPSPVQTQPDPAPGNNATLFGPPVIPLAEKNLASQKIKRPATASAPRYHYTAYGRLKLNASIASRIRKNEAFPKPLAASKNTGPDGIPAGLTRVRTRIDARPRLHPLDFTIPPETLARINNSSSAEFGEIHGVVQPVAKLDSPKPMAQSVAQPVAKPIEQNAAVSTADLAKEAVKYERVNKHVVWYTQHRGYLHQVAERAHPYLYHIVESLASHKLPYELALLPIVESAYQPTAQSPKSAAGLWQFIPSTGNDFDLRQSEQYDARLDIAASTQAAARYLSFLKQHFNGDWLLALAAYNCGLGTVDAAIDRNKADGLAADYWSLRLPEETQEYVPRFLALSSIFANPAAHGLKLAPVRNEPYFVKVKIDRKHDIDYLAEKDFTEVAQLANLGYEQFSRLNPGYLNPKLTAQGPFTFLLPPANASQLHQRLTSIAQFMNESTASASHLAPLKKRSLLAVDGPQTALSLLADIALPKGADLMTAANPFLSLDLNQSAPRMANQSVISPVGLNVDPKRVKKNI